jgi:hypothetical protein
VLFAGADVCNRLRIGSQQFFAQRDQLRLVHLFNAKRDHCTREVVQAGFDQLAKNV